MRILTDEESRDRYYVDADFFRNEWFGPGDRSSRIRGDADAGTLEFITEADGTRESADSLREKHSILPLYFRPSLGREIVDDPVGVLEWATRDTGRLGFSPSAYSRFCVNDLGLIAVVAVDVAGLPTSLQRRFVAHNVAPEGGLNEEASRMWYRGEWIDSPVSPEVRLQKGISRVDEAALAQLGEPLFLPHAATEDILRSCSRFRAIDAVGYRTLAKDVCRITVDRLKLDLLKKHTSNLDAKMGSLKRLQHLLSERGVDGGTIMGALFAVYDLRQDDAHLPSGDRENALRILGCDATASWVRNAEILLDCVADALFEVERGLCTGG